MVELWDVENVHLLPFPKQDYPACETRPVKANSYIQVVFEINHYSGPHTYTKSLLTVLDLVTNGEVYVCMEIRVAKNEFTFRFIDANGPMTFIRMKYDGEKIYERVGEDESKLKS